MPHDQVLRLALVAIVVQLAGLVAGCGQSGLPRGAVSGQVTLDGAPLQQGSILFVPIDGTTGVAAGALIIDGHYELSGEAGASPGVNRVEIRSVRKSGRQEQKPFAPAGEMIETDEEAVAAAFNTASTLTRNVQAGQQTIDFAVTSRPRQNRAN